MKKKIKLFSTIASLCLAVALMAFGVWAASSVSFSITNNVSFSATENVKAKVWHTTAVTNCTQTGAATDKSETDPDIELKGGESTVADIAIGDVVLKATNEEAGQKMTYSYTITIKNTAKSTDSIKYLKVEVTGKAVEYTAANGYKIETTYSEGAAATHVLDAEESMTFTVTITVDVETSITSVDLGTKVALTAQKTNA